MCVYIYVCVYVCTYVCLYVCITALSLGQRFFSL